MKRPAIMGIVNVTPDSFSGDGVLAEAANHFARGARSKERRARAAHEAIRAATELRESFQHRKAA